jgi:hypothetical protein
MTINHAVPAPRSAVAGTGVYIAGPGRGGMNPEGRFPNDER